MKEHHGKRIAVIENEFGEVLHALVMTLTGRSLVTFQILQKLHFLGYLRELVVHCEATFRMNCGKRFKMGRLQKMIFRPVG